MYLVKEERRKKKEKRRKTGNVAKKIDFYNHQAFYFDNSDGFFLKDPDLRRKFKF